MQNHQRIAIVTDSISDLSPDFAATLGVTIVPLAIRFGRASYGDRVDITTDELVARMFETNALPATSSPSKRDFVRVFRELAPDHDAIVAILNSSHLSSTVKSARMASSENIGIPVEIVDSLNVSYGLGFQALRAVALRDAGADVTTIADRLRAEVAINHVVFFVETLEHLRRNGRVGKASEMLGSLLQLKPVLRIDEGQVIPFERARTRAKALDGLVSFAESLPAIDEIAVIYDTTPEDVESILPRLRLLVPAHKLQSIQFGPALATHIGPGVVGIAIREKPIF